MREIFDLVTHVSDLAVNVLIVGESGTGKEMIARAIHQTSARAARSFIPINCAAIPETLLESELFGYVRGAFTDARKDRRGLFQAASGGVLFLDEISEIPLGLQAKLLRVIEDKEVRPLEQTKVRKWTPGWFQRATAIQSFWSRKAASGRTSTTGSTSFESICHPFARERKIFRF